MNIQVGKIVILINVRKFVFSKRETVLIMVKNTIAILDYTDFFVDKIKVHKNFKQQYITLKNKNCIKYFTKTKVEENEVYAEIIKIGNYIKKDEIEDFIENNLLRYELIMILKECKDNNSLKELIFLNRKLREKNLKVLNILYGKYEFYKDIEFIGKIILDLKENKQNLFNETKNIYNSILNLTKNNKKLLFNLCNEENIPILNLNLEDIKNIGEGVLYILKSFKDLQYLDVLILTLISRKKISIEDVCYIKDPLEEYMYYDKKIIIQELVEEDYKENLTINLIGIK